MATDSFEEFLRKKKNQENPIDWDKRKEAWLKSIDEFYKNVKKWLEPFTNQSLLKITEKEGELNEDYIGNYKINQLDILLGNDIVSLKPRGTLILGSFGRIDIRGPKGDAIIVEQKWNEWEFVNSYDRLKRWKVNDESFKAIIQDLING